MLKVEEPKTIKCPKCGHDTGLPQNGFLMVIPDGGLKCPCGTIILYGPNHRLQEYKYETDPYLDTAYGRVYTGYSDRCYMPGPDKNE